MNWYNVITLPGMILHGWCHTRPTCASLTPQPTVWAFQRKCVVINIQKIQEYRRHNTVMFVGLAKLTEKKGDNVIIMTFNLLWWQFYMGHIGEMGIFLWVRQQNIPALGLITTSVFSWYYEKILLSVVLAFGLLKVMHEFSSTISGSR